MNTGRNNVVHPKGQKSTVPKGAIVTPRGGNPGWAKLTGGAEPIGKQSLGGNSGGSSKKSGY